MTPMYVLTGEPYPEQTRHYAALGSVDAAAETLARDVHAGRLDPHEADAVLMGLPLVALEDAARRTGYLRMQDAVTSDEFVSTAAAVAGADISRLVKLQQIASQLWLRYVWEATGREELTVDSERAATLRHTELSGYTTDDIRLPGRGRAIHIGVAPSASLEVADARGRRWTATHLLVVEEPSPRRMWRLCLEGGTFEAPGRHVLAMALPPGVPLDNAMAQHESRAAPGMDWRGVWTWALGAVLTQSLPASKV